MTFNRYERNISWANLSHSALQGIYRQIPSLGTSIASRHPTASAYPYEKSGDLANLWLGVNGCQRFDARYLLFNRMGHPFHDAQSIRIWCWGYSPPLQLEDYHSFAFGISIEPTCASDGTCRCHNHSYCRPQAECRRFHRLVRSRLDM
jgi:hypothetical protein